MAASASDMVDRLGRGVNSLGRWIDARFPLSKLIKKHATEYYASKNFNFWYGFGVLATVVLVMQIVTGIALTMNYKPSAADAFASVQYIMRDVDWGLVDTVSALHRRVGVFHRRLSAHISRLAVRLLQEAAGSWSGSAACSSTCA